MFVILFVTSPSAIFLDVALTDADGSQVYGLKYMGGFRLSRLLFGNLITAIPTTRMGSFVLIFKDSSGDLIYCFHIWTAKPYDFVFMVCHAYLIIAVIRIKNIACGKVEPVYTASFILSVFFICLIIRFGADTV